MDQDLYHMITLVISMGGFNISYRANEDNMAEVLFI